MEAKSCLKSKTVWLNCLTVATGVVGYLAANDVVMQYPHLVAGLIVTQGLLNIALRFITKVPVK